MESLQQDEDYILIMDILVVLLFLLVVKLVDLQLELLIFIMEKHLEQKPQTMVFELEQMA